MVAQFERMVVLMLSFLVVLVVDQSPTGHYTTSSSCSCDVIVKLSFSFSSSFCCAEERRGEERGEKPVQ